MAAAAKPVIIDASVVLAWLLPDETTTPKANQLYAQAAQGEINFIAPHLLFYEVLNGLRSAVIQKRLQLNQLAPAINQFLQLDITLQHQTNTALDITKQALKLNLSVYDATYVFLAQTFKTTLYTADSKLAQKTPSLPSIFLL